MPTTFIFNQYYIDFLKRLKAEAKKDNTSDLSKTVLKAIKENYVTFDKSSEEYIEFLQKQIPEDVWEKYVENNENWLSLYDDLEIYKGITIENATDLMKDEYLCNHFMSVFYIFQKDLSEEGAAEIIKILQSIDTADMIDKIEDEKIKKVLENLQIIRNKNIKEKSGMDMKFIEDTTIGKLAKEILEDIDVGKLQKSIGEKGDVLKAIGDPDSGFAEVISSVSRKMANKISNGELKQENLIQDAMKFASTMPGLFGGNGPAKGGSGGTGRGGTPDMSGMMSMMAAMMGGMGGNGGGGMNDMFREMAKGSGSGSNGNGSGNGKAPKNTKKMVNESALKRLAKAKQLKKKLHDRAKENREKSDDE